MLPHRQRLQARRDQHASARIDGERAKLYPLSIDVLDQSGLAACLVDGKNGDAVLAACKYLLALDLDRRRGAICQINEAAVRMHVNGTGRLPCGRLRVRQRPLHK